MGLDATFYKIKVKNLTPDCILIRYDEGSYDIYNEIDKIKLIYFRKNIELESVIRGLTGYDNNEHLAVVVDIIMLARIINKLEDTETIDIIMELRANFDFENYMLIYVSC
jgi:hypothetical protein